MNTKILIAILAVAGAAVGAVGIWKIKKDRHCY